MGVIFKIAWRNLLRHKGKTIVIGSILFLGSMIMTFGNSVVTGMDRGIQDNIVDRFCGDIVLVSTNQKQNEVIGSMTARPIEALTGYTNVKKVLQQQDYVDQYLPVGINLAMMLGGGFGMYNMLMIIGVDFEDYQAMFHTNVQLVEGSLLSKDQRGILYPHRLRNNSYDFSGFWVKAKDGPLIKSNMPAEALSNIHKIEIKEDLVLMGNNADEVSADVRVDIQGIIEFSSFDQFWGANFAVLDLQSFRDAFAYNMLGSDEVDLSEETESLLGAEGSDMENLFEEGDFFELEEETESGEISYDEDFIRSQTERNIEKKVYQNPESGLYNAVFVKIDDSISLDHAIEDLSVALSNADVDARAVSWRDASVQFTSVSTLIRTALTIFVFFLFFVAIIVITNTLSMTAMERVSEIGMMRAVGARKSVIRRMFFAETTLISAVFGGAGIVAGSFLAMIISLFRITSENEALKLLFGGDVFHPVLGFGDILIVIAQLALVTFIAMLYPARLASKIRPLDAVSRD